MLPLHISLLLALVGPPGSRLGGRPHLLPTTTGARRRGVSAAVQVAMSGLGSARLSRPERGRTRPASLVFTTEDPTPTVELYADGTVNQYTSTLTSMRGRYKLSTRDVRLLRSSTRARVVIDRPAAWHRARTRLQNHAARLAGLLSPGQQVGKAGLLTARPPG